MLVIGLSGPVAVGKSTLAGQLETDIGAVTITVSDVLRSFSRLSTDTDDTSRADLSEIGDQLSERTAGRWLIEYIVDNIGTLESDRIVVVDAVRRMMELRAVRSAPTALHVYLDAPLDTLEVRYTLRGRDQGSYVSVRQHSSEAALPQLRELADITLDATLDPSILSDRIEVAVRNLRRSTGE